MAEDALKICRIAKTRFTRKKNELFKAIAEKKGTEILKRKFDELTNAWSTVKGKHDIYSMYLTEKEITAKKKNYKKNTMKYRRYILSMTMKEKFLNWRNKKNWTAKI